MTLLVAVFAVAPLALGAQQEPERVVRGLSFEGNHAIDDYALSTAIVTTNSSTFATSPFLRWMGLGEKRTFDELEFRRDVIRLVLLYRQSGYMNVVVDTLVQRDGRDVYVKFRLYEGDPVRLGALELQGLDGILDLPRLKRDLPLRVGDPFNRLLFQAAGDTVVSRLRNRGYPYADVLRNYDVDVAAQRATATLEALPGPRMRVREVLIRQAEEVDTATVRRVLSVKPGDWFNQEQLYLTQRDLYGLGLFRSVNVVLADTTPPPGDSGVRVMVRVIEAPRHRLRFGAGYGTLDCFRVQSGWTAYDFLGGARALDVTAQLSKIGVGIPTDANFKENVCRFLQNDSTSNYVNYNTTVSLQQPAFLSPRHTASFSVFAEWRSEYRTYTRQAVGANVAVTLNARRNVPVTLGYSYSVGRTTANPAVYCLNFRVCNDSDQVFLANRRPFGAITATVLTGHVNSLLDPSRGSIAQLTLVYASRYVLSDSLYEFNRGELDISRYWPLSRRTVLAVRARGGVILPQAITLSGQSAKYIPPDQRFYAGGPNSVRGYLVNQLGPRVYVRDIKVTGTDTTFGPIQASPTGGNTVFTGNLELRLPMPVFPDRLRLGVFVDAGQVWERGNPGSVEGLRVTPGVGLRFVTALGPVRLDAAYNGYPSERGTLYYQNTADGSLTAIRIREPEFTFGFWRRVVVQFAVGQVF